MHRKSRHARFVRRNDRLAAGTKRLMRKSNDVDEEMDRLGVNARQRPKCGKSKCNQSMGSWI
eukprot:10751283-Lingulodinium_polyedra.AAC.1